MKSFISREEDTEGGCRWVDIWEGHKAEPETRYNKLSERRYRYNDNNRNSLFFSNTTLFLSERLTNRLPQRRETNRPLLLDLPLRFLKNYRPTNFW